MASISHDWERDRDLPQTLQALLNETVINNSFDNKDTTNQLIASMESAYAHLYRYQKDTVPFANFHYQTREYLLNTTYNDIQDGLKRYGDELMELEKQSPRDEERIAELKRIIAELGEVRFGDIFLDRYRRMCFEVPYDMIETSVREAYRRSPLYNKPLALSEIATNDKMFYRIPIVILDHKVRTDISVLPIEKGTRFTFLTTKATDLYTGTESQKFHDINVIFVENIFFHQSIISGPDINTLRQTEFTVPFSITDFQVQLTNSIKSREGILFCSIGDSKKNTTHLMECSITDTGITFDGNDTVTEMIAEETETLVINLWFCNHMYRYSYYANSGDVGVYRLADKNAEGGYRPCSGIFIPSENQVPFKMPIPEDKFLITKRLLLTDDPKGPYEYQPVFGVDITMYYPNFYQITDPDMEYTDLYRVYFFYKKESGMKYTPLCAYYAEYLRLHYNYKYTLEEILNMVYFKLPGYNQNFYMIENYGVDPTNPPGLIDGKALSQFYYFFERLLEYKDYDYMYGTPDFMVDYIGEDIPLQYKIARMREFVRADYHVLMDYVRREQDKTHLLHFFVNTIELRDRFRRSTRIENPHKSVSFAAAYEIVDPGKVGSLKVVDNEDYDPDKEIHIGDVKMILPEVSLGDYVTSTNLVERYVFTFKNPSKTDVLPIKIYVDGLLVINYELINVFGMEYLYIPTHLISEDSYVMVEIDREMENAQRIPVVAKDNATWIACHFLNTPGLTYTMNDIAIRDENDNVIDSSEYELVLTSNNIDYDMIDERNEKVNEYGIMTDIKVKMLKGPFPRNVTIVLNKISFIKSVIAQRRGYCKFDIKALGVNPDVRLTRMYFNGRLVSPMFFKTIKQSGREYIQSRIYCQKGDEFLFEYAPYAKETILEIEEFSQNDPFDFTDILDKPVHPDYYEFFVNGRRLGRPNLFEFGPHHAVFRGLVSKYMLAVYQKERDFEYFGYDMINMDASESTYHYYFEPIDLVENEFITDEEKEKIIDIFIDHVKEPEDMPVKPNEDLEDPIEYIVANEVKADLEIFYFEEVLPLTLGDPNKLQFLQEFISVVYPYTTAIYEQEHDDTKVVFLDPNITVHIHDPKEQVSCGEQQTSCTKATSCQKMSKAYDEYQEVYDQVNLFFDEEFPNNLMIMKYPGVVYTDYELNFKVQNTVLKLQKEMKTLLKYVQDYRVVTAVADYDKIKKAAMRCDKKLKSALTAIDGIGVHLSPDITMNYTFFVDSVERLDPASKNPAAYRCANENYPYVDGGEGVYDIIPTGDIDIPNSTVLLLGEEDFTALLTKEGQIDPPKPDLYATEFTKRLYDIPNIYVQGLT